MTNSGRAEELVAGGDLTSGNPMPLNVEAELHHVAVPRYSQSDHGAGQRAGDRAGMPRWMFLA
jgi:hypothetical protein